MSKQDEYKAKQKLQSKVLFARDIKREQKAEIKKQIEKRKREEWEREREEMKDGAPARGKDHTGS